MKMLKPQEKHEDVFMKMEYPEKVRYYSNILKELIPEIQYENIEGLAEAVYKAAYLDGFKDALFFADID